MASVLASILFGAALVLATAYGLGLAVLRKTPAPPEIVLALGGAAESVVIFFLLLAGAGRPSGSNSSSGPKVPLKPSPNANCQAMVQGRAPPAEAKVAASRRSVAAWK